MDLFSNTIAKDSNLLPEGGTVNYYGRVMSKEEADRYYEMLLESIDWKHDEAIIYGKHFITKRKAAWYGDKPFAYTYSNTTKYALPWTKELWTLKTGIEELTNTVFNTCLLNLYHNGDEGMAWHSDDESSLVKGYPIASVSLGAERRFSFKHKRLKETISILLAHGSLLVMKDDTQNNWLHSIPKTKKVNTPRINLTFRKMAESA